ncbi:MAG: PepSY domain-containing protein [Chitinophagaceae bacterium]|nr:PepSY domain-containing protein [Chitinophagaceae bacterium]
MSLPRKKPLWHKIRNTFIDIHLWLGIGSGIILFLVCLSGTIYAFSTEIQEMMAPQRYTVKAAPGAVRLPADSIVAKVSQQVKGKILFISIPADKARTCQVSILESKKEGGRAMKEAAIAGKQKGGKESPEKGREGKAPRGTVYFIDPYTGMIKDKADNGSPFFLAMFRLHRWLLLDQEIGRPIVGCATLIFVFIIITGLVIWIPQRVRSWKQGLKIKFSGNWKRINHDLHNSLGFYSSFLLLIMALTGLTWSFPWYKDGVNKLLGAYKPGNARGEKPLKSVIPVGDSIFHFPMQPLSTYLQRADRVLSYEGNYMLTYPADSAATVSLTKTHVGFFAPVAGDKMQFDQYSGKVLKTEIFRDKPLGQRISGSFRALHVGNVYGMFTKILYFIACLIATSLPVTGTLIWINKLKIKRRKKVGPIVAGHRP